MLVRAFETADVPAMRDIWNEVVRAENAFPQVVANASYAVASAARGKGAGEALVRESLRKAKELGFRVMQFNAVVASNSAAIRLYEKIGFEPLGTVPGAYRHNDGTFEDIRLFCFDLTKL